jgi:hypothetical protein
MGKGGDGLQAPVKKSGLLKRVSSSSQKLVSITDDLKVLKSIWLTKASGSDHKERLDNFYGPQADACTPSLDMPTYAPSAIVAILPRGCMLRR